MAHYTPDRSTFGKLKDSVIVISGAATGIGAATAKLLSNNGARVYIGDVNHKAAEALCKSSSGLIYVPTDVSKYDEIYNLFRTAFDREGRVDHAISCAGIFETGNWFDPNLDIDSVKSQGNLKVLDVNVHGTLNFSRIAAPFLRYGRQEGQDRSLVLLSSVNAFRESPGLYIYQTGKHAVHGLLRASRKILWERDRIRVAAVCPGVTESEMTRHIIGAFKENDLYWQSSEAVAEIIVGIQADSTIVGKAYYIEGGDAWEFEDGFYDSQPTWLGEGCKRMRANAEAVNRGVLTPKD